MSSFKRNRQTLVDPPGTRRFLGSQLLTSTGHAQLDELLGGGILCGSMILLEEDAGSTAPVSSTLNKGHLRSTKRNSAVGGLHSLTLAQLFAAEGIACGHRVFIAGSDGRITPSAFLGSLPLNVSQDSLDVQAALKSVQKQQEHSTTDSLSDNQSVDSHGSGLDSSGSGLLNAWQYKKYIPTSGGVDVSPKDLARVSSIKSGSTPPPVPTLSPQSTSPPTKYCHSFDLERNIRADVLASSAATAVPSVPDQTHISIKLPPSPQSSSKNAAISPIKHCSIAEAVLIAQSRSSQLSEEEDANAVAHASALVDFFNLQSTSLSVESGHSVYTALLDRCLNSALLISPSLETVSLSSNVSVAQDLSKRIVLETTPNPELKRRPSITNLSGDHSGPSPPPLPQSYVSNTFLTQSSASTSSSANEPSLPPLPALRTKTAGPPVVSLQSSSLIVPTSTSSTLSASLQTVSRLVLLGVGGPLWPGFCGSDAISSALNSNSAGLPHEDAFKSYRPLFRFVSNLRASLERQRLSTGTTSSVILVTMPTWCMPISVAAHIRKLFDIVLKLHAFGDPTYSLATSRSNAKTLASSLSANTAPEFKDYTGMLIVRRLPRGVVIAGGSGSASATAATPILLPDSLIWAMRREKRKIVIERPHLPPAGEESSGSSVSNKIPQQAQVSFTFGDTEDDEDEIDGAQTSKSETVTALEPGLSCKPGGNASSLDF